MLGNFRLLSLLKVANSGNGGIDTSDATATEQDLPKGKTAYVNNKKITGTIDEVPTGQTLSSSGTMQVLPGETRFIGTTPVSLLFRPNSSLALKMSNDTLRNQFGITPEKIVKGNNILDMEGTAESEATSQLFSFPGTDYGSIDDKWILDMGGQFPVADMKGIKIGDYIECNPTTFISNNIAHSGTALFKVTEFYNADYVNVKPIAYYPDVPDTTTETIKTLDTIENMQAIENPQQGDLVLVYKPGHDGVLKQDSKFSKAVFPATVTLTNWIDGYYYWNYQGEDGLDLQFTLSDYDIRIEGYGINGDYSISYMWNFEENGTTREYIREECRVNGINVSTGIIDFQTIVELSNSTQWNEYIPQIMQLEKVDSSYKGLYEYKTYEDANCINFALNIDSDLNVGEYVAVEMEKVYETILKHYKAEELKNPLGYTYWDIFGLLVKESDTVFSWYSQGSARAGAAVALIRDSSKTYDNDYCYSLTPWNSSGTVITKMTFDLANDTAVVIQDTMSGNIGSTIIIDTSKTPCAAVTYFSSQFKLDSIYSKISNKSLKSTYTTKTEYVKLIEE